MLGLVVFWFRRLSPLLLTILGTLGIALTCLELVAFGGAMMLATADDRVAFQEEAYPPPEVVQAEVDDYRAGWLTQMNHRVPVTLYLQLFMLPFGGPQFAGLMLVGMALWKWGVLSGGLGLRRHLVLGAVLLGVGLVPMVWHTQAVLKTPNAVALMFFLPVLSVVGSSLMAVGLASMVAGLAAAGVLKAAGVALAAVGRLALSNYLLQTLICTTLFYGHGLGLFAELSRVQLLALVPVVWAVNVTASLLWLRHFTFGPA